jgi:hypothetical protein
MSASCCDQAVDPQRGNETYQRVLRAVLAINAVMFTLEVAAGLGQRVRRRSRPMPSTFSATLETTRSASS